MGIQKRKEASVWGKAVDACVPPAPAASSRRRGGG